MQAILNRAEHDRASVLALSGDIVLDDAADLYGELRRRASDRTIRDLEVDFGQVGTIDTAGAAAAKLGVELFERSGRKCELTHLSEQHSQAMALVSEHREPARERVTHSWLDRLASGAAQLRVLVD